MVISIKRLLCLLVCTGAGFLYAQTSVIHIEPKIFDYDELVRNAYPLDKTRTLYSVCKKDGRTTLTPLGYEVKFLGGYFFYKLWDIQNNKAYNDRQYIRTPENADIQIDLGTVQYVFGNLIFQGNPYTPRLWEIEKTTVTAKPYDLTAFSGYDTMGAIRTMFYDEHGGVFPEVDYSRRIRGNVVLFTGRPPEPGFRYRIYRFNRDAVELLAHSDNPLELHVPELKGYKEAFEIDGALYLQDIEHGTSIVLGRIKEWGDYFIRQGLEVSFWLYESNSKEYWYDIINNIVIPAEAVKNTDSSNIDIYGYNYFFQRWENDMWYFYAYNKSGETALIMQIATPLNGINAGTRKSGTKLYLSMGNLGLVYDMAAREIVEFYTTPIDLNPDTYPYHRGNWVIYCIPFGGRTYVYAEINSHFSASQR
jgi:hypothetical protein